MGGISCHSEFHTSLAAREKLRLASYLHDARRDYSCPPQRRSVLVPSSSFFAFHLFVVRAGWTAQASGAAAPTQLLCSFTKHPHPHSDLEGLSKLLESSQKANEDATGVGGVGSCARALCPGDIGPSNIETAPAAKATAATKDIWSADEVKEGDLFSTHIDPSDKRPEPVYKALHLQLILYESNSSPLTGTI